MRDVRLNRLKLCSKLFFNYFKNKNGIRIKIQVDYLFLSHPTNHPHSTSNSYPPIPLTPRAYQSLKKTRPWKDPLQGYRSCEDPCHTQNLRLWRRLPFIPSADGPEDIWPYSLLHTTNAQNASSTFTDPMNNTTSKFCSMHSSPQTKKRLATPENKSPVISPVPHQIS